MRHPRIVVFCALLSLATIGLTAHASADITATPYTSTLTYAVVPQPPSAIGSSVAALACPAAQSCVLLADLGTDAGINRGDGYIATEHGDTWTTEEMPVPNGATGPIPLVGAKLACPAVAECVAVPDADFSSHPRYFLLDHAGTWTAQIQPTAPDGDVVDITVLSCPTAGSCTAFGTDEMTSTPVVLSQTPSGWTATDTPLPPSGGCSEIYENCDITALSCPSPNHCVATGTYEERPSGYVADYALVQSSTTHWTAETLPPARPATGVEVAAYPRVTGLDCIPGGACTAVGNSVSSFAEQNVSGVPYLYTRTASGVWTSAPLPLPAIDNNGRYIDGRGLAESGTSSVEALSCPGASGWCAIGGLYQAEFPFSTEFLLANDSGSWQAIESPTVPDGESAVDVACGAVGFCVAVVPESGEQGGRSGQLYIESGGSWQFATIPTPGAPWNWFGRGEGYAAACPTTTSCTAAVTYEDEEGAGSTRILVLQLEAAGGTGPESPPGEPEGLTVQSPPPTPPLTVTIGNGGGGGTAGALDPSSLEHGQCDPGANTSWLHIAGITFACMVSLQFWSEPGLLSAKDKCLVSLSIDVAPFLKLLKARKYLLAAGTVQASLQALTRRLAVASYPKKLPGDVQAIDDLRTALQAIKTPEQALLTVISSRRVLDGLITKLGAGGPQALKLAQDLAVVKTAVISLVETVTGIRDVKDCVTAFGGP